MKWQRFLAWSFFALNLLDAGTTVFGISRGMKESNPLMAVIIAHCGLIGFVLFKVIVGSALTWWVMQLGKTWLAAVAAGSFALTAVNNTLALFLHH